MNDFDIPIFKRAYDLYKTFHEYRKLIPKQDRFTISERCEQSIPRPDRKHHAGEQPEASG